tara:strand:+ start:4120 stop:4284 length:165 start_codon:yes stop_codon:yes gene_type:complete
LWIIAGGRLRQISVEVADRAASDRSLLIAIDALLRSDRVEAAISVLERELGGGC